MINQLATASRCLTSLGWRLRRTYRSLKQRFPKPGQVISNSPDRRFQRIRIISGMTDADWCRENDIAVSTFYNWVSRCRKTAADQIPAPNYGHLEEPQLKQDVVPIDIVPEHLPEQLTASQMQQIYLDNSHTIEVIMKDVRIHVSNDVDPVLLTRTLHLIREISC